MKTPVTETSEYLHTFDGRRLVEDRRIPRSNISVYNLLGNTLY